MAPSGGGTGTGDWKTDGQHYRRCQRVQLPVAAAVHGTTEGECGLISKHIHHQLARCNPLFHTHNNNNNNNNHDNNYSAVIMTRSLREFTRFIW